MQRLVATVFALLVLVLETPSMHAQQYTRGVGVYPGNPAEDGAPTLVPAPATSRNLALRRPAYHSSSYDYNLTAQLVTDGIKESGLPRWVSTSTSRGGAVPKHERELLLDRSSASTVSLGGPSGWVQFEFAGGDAPFAVDRVAVEARPRAAAGQSQSAAWDWKAIVSGSDDGRSWTTVGTAQGTVPAGTPAGGYTTTGFQRGPILSIPLDSVARRRFYKIELETTLASPLALAEVEFSLQNRPVEVAGPRHFSSAWMAEGRGEEWVFVDLGATCAIDRVALFWIRKAAEGSIQVSDDGASWSDVAALPGGPGLTDELRLTRPARARYVRVRMTRPSSPEGYILSELEVYGTGGLVAQPKPQPQPDATGRLALTGGAWRLQRASIVPAEGAALSKVGFDDQGWVVATVPGTVLSSYWNAGALPDPNYGDNQLMISDSFFCGDFWYRTEFVAPNDAATRRAWLNFDGINWKADVFLNGSKVGRIEGAFLRGRFDVTALVRPGERNALAVRVEANATPGSTKQKTLESAGLNGGSLGADNPTYHASIGWDWIPPVRGRNIGIWNDVHLDTSGPVTLRDPAVRTTLPLPDTSTADVRLEVGLENHRSSAVQGTLRGRFGSLAFEQPVTLDGSSTKVVVLDPSSHPALRIREPKLWWPNGYGDPNLYDVEVRFEESGQVSDQASFKAGIRQFTYSEEGGALRIWINGRRFVGRGGNWGFPESNLRYRAREYDAAVGYHRDMNFTMIRDWVGQTGDEEFYEACDRYGIVVWQDFWLANPWDGPNPDDTDLFLKNADDYVRRIRSHPSVGLYCGRNEGNPPEPIEGGLRKLLAALHPDVHYIPNSAANVVSGEGPYGVQPAKFYFQSRATPKLHSELGMPNVVTYDSLRLMMPEGALWPQGLMWGLHDFNLTSAQRLSTFRTVVEKGFGGAENAADWVGLAQFVNYDGYRAMFEAQGRNRMGLLLWMSHPCWPSFVWQTYDYYFDPTAGYFGSKKGSEPLHIQWNPVTDDVEVVNYSGGAAPGLTAIAEVLDLDGTVKWTKQAAVDSREDSLVAPMALVFPPGLSPVQFVRLKLQRDGRVVSENFYWRGAEEGNYQALRTLPRVVVDASTREERQGDRWILTTDLRNTSRQPALMVRVKAVRAKSGDRILPAYFSDNYVALMPGESRTIRTELRDADTRGERPSIVVEGFNLAPNGR